MFQLELRKPRGDLTAVQESAEGIVVHAVGEAIEALQAERWSNGSAEPETMVEGPNDWERQVGPESHERYAAENSAPADPAVERAG